MLVVNARLRIPLSEMLFTFARSSGKGGQNVNKVNTKAVLHWNVAESPSLPEKVRERFMISNGGRINASGELVLTSERFRDQGRNVDDCLEKLKALLAEAYPEPLKRRATKPTKGAKLRRLKEKRQHKEIKAGRRPVRGFD